VDAERDVVDRPPTVVVEDGEAGDLERDLVGHGRVGGLGRRQLGSDHQLGQVGGRDGIGVDGGDRLATSDHRDPVGDLEDLLELVVDEDDRRPAGLQLAQVAEQLLDLLGDQDRGRLVEDEDPGAAEEHLDDLDALLLADLQRLDQVVGVDGQSIRIADLAQVPLGGVEVEDPAALGGLGPEDHVLEHRHLVGQHEVLVHHADARGDRIGRRGELDLLAVDLHDALVGRLHAVEDLHERRLAGAVLAADRVDLARFDGEVDVVVGDHAGEAFRDADQFDRRDHAAPPGTCRSWTCARQVRKTTERRPNIVDLRSGRGGPSATEWVGDGPISGEDQAPPGTVGTSMAPSMICCL